MYSTDVTCAALIPLFVTGVGPELIDGMSTFPASVMQVLDS